MVFYAKLKKITTIAITIYFSCLPLITEIFYHNFFTIVGNVAEIIWPIMSQLLLLLMVIVCTVPYPNPYLAVINIGHL